LFSSIIGLRVVLQKAWIRIAYLLMYSYSHSRSLLHLEDSGIIREMDK